MVGVGEVSVVLCGTSLLGAGATVAERLVVWMRGQLGRSTVVDGGGVVLGLGCPCPWVW